MLQKFLQEIERTSSVDMLQTVQGNNGENSVKIGRGKNGRFTYGNNFSVGNKGGRPKKLTAIEYLDSLGGFDTVFSKMLDDDIESLYALIDIYSGKYK
jgi:hypothetical protein